MTPFFWVPVKISQDSVEFGGKRSYAEGLSLRSFWANWRLLYVRGSFLRHSSKKTISDSSHFGFPPRPTLSQSPSRPSFSHLCKTSLTVCKVQLKWAAIFSTYQPCAFSLMISARSLTFCGASAVLRFNKVLSWSRVRNTQKLRAHVLVTSVDAFSVFTYLYILWFFHANLLTCVDNYLARAPSRFDKLSFLEIFA